MIAADGLRQLRKLAVIGKGTAALTAASKPAQFCGGTSVGRSCGSRATSGRALAAPNWPDVAMFPRSSRTGKVGQRLRTDPYCLSAKARQPDRAWDVLRFLSSHHVQTLLGVYQVFPPILKSALNDTNGWPKPPPANTKAFTDHVLRDGVPEPAWDGWGEHRARTEELLLSGFEGKMSMKAAGDATAEVCDRLLEDLRRQGRGP